MLRIDVLLETSKSNPKKARGFTLIELLVAISVLAIIAVLGWRGLDSLVRARVALTEELERARGLQLAFAQMQWDCEHIVSPVNLPGRAPLAVEPGRMILVRNVFAENQPTRLQVIAYRLNNGLLTRRESIATRDLNALGSLWNSVASDAGMDRSVVLQSGVASMAVRAWVNDGNGWRDDIAATTEPVMIRDAAGNWRPATGTDTAANVTGPSGLEVALQLQGSATAVRKIFLLGSV